VEVSKSVEADVGVGGNYRALKIRIGAYWWLQVRCHSGGWEHGKWALTESLMPRLRMRLSWKSWRTFGIFDLRRDDAEVQLGLGKAVAY
jgi:hypothetical protein